MQVHNFLLFCFFVVVFFKFFFHLFFLLFGVFFLGFFFGFLICIIYFFHATGEGLGT